MIYSKRNNFFEKEEAQWRITDDALMTRWPTGTAETQRWADIVSVRLAYAPTSQKSWRHLMELKFRSGAMWTIDNCHFKGVGDFEDRSATYSPFVHEVVENIRRHAPNVRASAGASPAGYWLNIAMLLVVFSFLVWILLLVDYNVPGIAMVKLAIILISLPVLFSWVVRARPRAMKLDAIPADALPKGG